MSDGPVLELYQLTKRFGAVVAVNGISETLTRGEYFCLLGPSGCGKTTLLRLIGGFESPDSGAIRLHGRDVSGIPPERRDVNVVFQNYALFPHLTVAQNVAFGLRMKRVAPIEIRDRVSDAVRLVRLEKEADRLPREISGGQQQRVALARALVNRPALLLLDEPLSALDPSLRLLMQAELRRVQRETGVTFLHITHDQDEALSLADRIGVMRAGNFEQVGSPRELYERPASRFVASFVGAANLLEGRVTGPGKVKLGDDFVLDFPSLSPTLSIGDEVTLVIRPESISVSTYDSTSTLSGRVIRAAFRGSEMEYEIEPAPGRLPPGTTLRALVAAGAADIPIPEGQSVGLSVQADDWVALPGGISSEGFG